MEERHSCQPATILRDGTAFPVQSPRNAANPSPHSFPLLTSLGCWSMMTLVSVTTGASGKQLHMHTTVGRLREEIIRERANGGHER